MGAIGGFIEDTTGLDVSNQSTGDRMRAAQQAQQDATNSANSTQKQMFEEQRQDAAPWRQAGSAALSQMQNPDFQKDFTMADFQADPGYQFRMQEGQKALERSAAAKGGLNSGATLKALSRYSQGVASDEYQNAYNRFNNDRTTRFNRLSSIAGAGQTANTQLSQAGTSMANQISSNTTNMGNAQAAGQMAMANQQNNMIGQGLTLGAMYMMSDERLKTDIKPVDKKELAELRKTLKPYMFRYLDERHGKGNFVGVMAQDLEKSRLGRTLVVTNKQGYKQIDLLKLQMLLLATLAEG